MRMESEPITTPLKNLGRYMTHRSEMESNQGHKPTHNPPTHSVAMSKVLERPAADLEATATHQHAETPAAQQQEQQQQQSSTSQKRKLLVILHGKRIDDEQIRAAIQVCDAWGQGAGRWAGCVWRGEGVEEREGVCAAIQVCGAGRGQVDCGQSRPLCSVCLWRGEGG